MRWGVGVVCRRISVEGTEVNTVGLKDTSKCGVLIRPIKTQVEYLVSPCNRVVRKEAL